MDSQKRKIRVCVIDDEESLVSVLKDELAREGFEVAAALNGSDGIRLLEHKTFDVCLLDLNMPGLNGLDVLGKAAQQAIPTEFIVLTACATVQTAVESIRLGAYDYLTKPCNLDRIVFLIKKAHEKRCMRQESLILRRMTEARGAGITTASKAMLQVLKEAEKVARTEAPVLILGESGTGKEVMAEFIHANSSRSEGPFIVFNSAAIQENLFESELFGYEKGAFTGANTSKEGLFELADGGTLFLDEIGEVPQQMQAKLLRAIEKGTFYKVGGTKEIRVDIRVLSATNKDLPGMAKGNAFRDDLYYRLSSITLTLPPLRERREDIKPLVEELLARLPAGYTKSIDDDALELMARHDWPGNIRELQNVVNRAAILSDSGRIGPGDLPPEFNDSPVNPPRPAQSGGLLSLCDLEREHIIRVLCHTAGQRKKAAEILGIDVKTLYRKLKQYGIS
jgi:DNA-binding NtrC family response regulator